MTKRIKPHKKRKCSICGVSFQPIRSNNDKCSELCRAQWYRNATEKRLKDRRERNKKNQTLKKCRVCGVKFKAAPSRKNCSSECSSRYIKEGLGFRHYYLKNLGRLRRVKYQNPQSVRLGITLKSSRTKNGIVNDSPFKWQWRSTGIEEE